jgi:outer membrane protein assembly factor BamB
MDGTVYAVSVSDGAALFARELGAATYSIPLVHENTVYISSLDKCLYAIDCTNWKDRWMYETDGRIFSSPVIANGSVWIGSNDGRLYELNPDTGALKHFFQATERIVNAVAFNKNHMFVPTVANEMYCLRQKPDHETS